MKAVFLDRDGVINPLVFNSEHCVLDSPLSAEKFKLMPGVAKAIRKLNLAKIKVIVISNQPAVAKGKMPLSSLKKIDNKMNSLLKRHSAFLNDIRYCFHHPKEGKGEYKKKCICRKPKPGLIISAAHDHSINLKASFVVGDNLTDIQAGRAAGVKTILLGNFKCDLCRLMDKKNARPDFIVPDLLSAVSIILKERKEK